MVETNWWNQSCHRWFQIMVCILVCHWLNRIHGCFLLGQTIQFSESQVLAAQSFPTLQTLKTVACQAPLSMEFSRQNYWSGYQFPSPGDFPNPGIEPRCLALQADSLPSELPGKPHSVQFSHWVMSNSLQPHGLQHTGLPVHHQLPEFTQTHVHLVIDAIQPSHPLAFPSPLTFNLSQHQGLFKWVSSSHQVAKVLDFQFQHQDFHEYSGLISFRLDWLNLLAFQVTLKSLLQHHRSKASIFWCSAFFIAQLSHPYMTTGKTIGLTKQTFVGKVMRSRRY